MNNLIKPEIKERAGSSFLQSGESLTKATARIYTELQAWGETKAAAIIAEAEGVTPTTIHNRLQLARSSKYLKNPGKGARKKNI
jgi:transcription initiation factor TFIIIB Brf1 subunit/transcription initiation factor TFIIB